jgi:hypothetical protein
MIILRALKSKFIVFILGEITQAITLNLNILNLELPVKNESKLFSVKVFELTLELSNWQIKFNGQQIITSNIFYFNNAFVLNHVAIIKS